MEGMASQGIPELKSLLDEAYGLDLKIEDMKASLKVEQEKYDALERKILALLEYHNLENLKTSNLSVSVRSRQSLRIPQGPDKELFFQYLKTKNQFEALATIHSNTLNAWYKQEQEAAIREQRMLLIPGLGMPTVSKSLILKKHE